MITQASQSSWIGAWWLTLLYMGLVLALTSLPHVPELVQLDGGDKLEHFAAYCLMGLLVRRSFSLRAPTATPWQHIPAASSIAGAYAVADELHQLLIPGRSCELADLLADWGGIAIAMVLSVMWMLAINHRNRIYHQTHTPRRGKDDGNM